MFHIVRASQIARKRRLDASLDHLHTRPGNTPAPNPYALETVLGRPHDYVTASGRKVWRVEPKGTQADTDARRAR